MARLEDLIAASQREWLSTTVETAVFGTGEPQHLARLVADLCATELSAPLVSGLFYEVSVGCVFGVELAGGERVVVKAYQRRWSPAFLTAVRRVQTRLADSGFPCARPIVGPVALGAAVAVVESSLPDPGPQPITDAMLRVSASGLWHQIESCAGVDPTGLEPHPLSKAPNGLYPEPHSPIFDFAATAAGAEWIDDFARAAVDVRDRDAGDPVIAHTDWSVRNVRMDAERILVAYDWDSLASVRESLAVGQAAATWRSRGEPGETAPTVDEIVRYTRAYEDARGHPFDRRGRDAVGAAALYALAYTARCEHAVDPERAVHRRARPRLEVDGEQLLGFADRFDRL